jgi:hypothetical protein
VDVKLVIFSLKRAGFSFKGLAYLVSRTDRTIANWAKGKGKPDYDVWIKLMAIYREHVPTSETNFARSSGQALSESVN